MRKVRLLCSLLMAFCTSMFAMGCDAAKKSEMGGPAPKPATSPAPKQSKSGSTTGGGVEVPAGKGSEEKPAAKAEEKKPEEAKPEETKTEENKTEEKKPE